MDSSAIRSLLRAGLAIVAVGLAAGPSQGEVTSLGSVRFVGDIDEDEDISAVAKMGRHLFLASDETTAIELLEEQAGGDYRVRPERRIEIVEGNKEVDFEAMAVSDGMLYATGSHAWLRKKLDDGDSVAKNRETLNEVELENSRCNVVRLSIDPESGAMLLTDRINIRQHLLRDPVLGRFCNIPSKENGLDIEGLAVDGDRVYLGVRSPVLRGNLVPVVVFDFDRPRTYQLLYLDLDGQGIREMQKVNTGFLVLGGPPADGPSKYSLYWWNGRDRVPGSDLSEGGWEKLGDFPKHDGNPEGMTVLQDKPDEWELLVVFDGVEGGAPERFRATRD